MHPTIKCMYSCRPCGLHKVTVDVPARTTEDVKTWFDHVLGPALAQDHARRSPHCQPHQLPDVMIPITGADCVGGPAVQ